MQGGLEKSNCRFDSIESTRIVSLDVELSCGKLTCAILRNYSSLVSFHSVSIRHTGSGFARDLKNIAPLDYAEWVEIVAIRFASNESTRIA